MSLGAHTAFHGLIFDTGRFLYVSSLEVNAKAVQTFQAMLEDQFAGCPGEKEVKRRQYRIFRADSYDEVLNEGNWGQSNLRKARLVMSVLFDISTPEIETCPRGCNSALNKTLSSKAVWLVFRVQLTSYVC